MDKVQDLYAELFSEYERVARQPIDIGFSMSRITKLEPYVSKEADLLPRWAERNDARWSYFGPSIVEFLKQIPPHVRSTLAVQSRDTCLVEMLHVVNFVTNDFAKHAHLLADAIKGVSLTSLLSTVYTLKLYATNPSPRHKMAIWGSLGHAISENGRAWIAGHTDPEVSGNPSLRLQVGDLLRSFSINALRALAHASTLFEFGKAAAGDRTKSGDWDSPFCAPPNFKSLWRTRSGTKEVEDARKALERAINPDTITFQSLWLGLDVILRTVTTAPQKYRCFSGLAAYPLGIGPNEVRELQRSMDIAAMHEGLKAFAQNRSVLPKSGSIVTPLMFRRGMELRYTPEALLVGAAPYQSIVSHQPGLLPYVSNPEGNVIENVPNGHLAWAIGVIGHAVQGQVAKELKYR